MKDHNETQRARLEGELYMPLPGQEINLDVEIEEGPWSEAAMAASFRAAQVEMGGGTSG
jgi:hypothetical protein